MKQVHYNIRQKGRGIFHQDVRKRVENIGLSTRIVLTEIRGGIVQASCSFGYPLHEIFGCGIFSHCSERDESCRKIIISYFLPVGSIIDSESELIERSFGLISFSESSHVSEIKQRNLSSCFHFLA